LVLWIIDALGGSVYMLNILRKGWSWDPATERRENRDAKALGYIPRRYVVSQRLFG